MVIKQAGINGAADEKAAFEKARAKNHPVKIRRFFIFALAVYFGFGIYLLTDYQHQINPDGVSYISIAQKYLQHNFSEALNGYWGPLFSWLLTLPLSLIASPLLAAKILALLIGALALFGIFRLSYRFEIPGFIRGVLLLALIPVILRYAYGAITPDLLIATTLIFYLVIIFDPGYNRRQYHGWLGGALGSLSYLAKSFGLPFFVAHFVLFNGLHYLGSATKIEKKTVIKNFIFGLGVFFLISGSWIFLLSRKYDRLTFSTAASYNAKIGRMGQHHTRMLIAPTNPTAISGWEDPSYIQFEAPTTADSAAGNAAAPTVSNLISAWLPGWSRLRTNFHATIAVFKSFSVSAVIIIMAGLVYCGWAAKQRRQNVVLQTLLTIGLYSGGYMLIIVEARYLQLTCFLLMLLAASLPGLFFKDQTSIFRRALITLAPILLLASFALKPLRLLTIAQAPGKNLYALSVKLNNAGDLHGNIASDEQWVKTTCLAFLNNYKYYGATGRKPREALLAKLEQYNIDYYFVWDKDVEFDGGYKEITGGKIPHLKIYSLKEKLRERLVNASQ